MCGGVFEYYIVCYLIIVYNGGIGGNVVNFFYLVVDINYCYV